MRVVARLTVVLVVLMLASLAFWRVLVTGMADHLAVADPQRALDWDPHQSAALAAQAREQLKRGQPVQAAARAQDLLRREPLNGSAWILLADAAEKQSNKAQASLLSSIAIRRAPYALSPRARLAAEQLELGHYDEALENLDQLLRLSPARQNVLFPILIELANDAGFADALALKLSQSPSWRASFINDVLSKASPERVAAIFSALQRHADLDPVSTGRWIERLVADGKWGEAYARWVAGIKQAGSFRVGQVYNGHFDSEPTGVGFDWRIGDSAGVLIERAALVGSDGSPALRLTFLGRRVETIPVHQWLLLGPGRYRLRLRAAAQDLRSDRGLQWMLRCMADGRELAASERLDGNFDWKSFEVDFLVPDQDCPAQDLWLRNAGAAAAGKIVRGLILFDDFAIDRIDSGPGTSPALSPH